MGWHINLVKNEPKISKKCAKELFKVDQDHTDYWFSEADVLDEDNTLSFNVDFMEHQDSVMHEDEIIKVLKKHKIKGDICFSSEDGDNSGEHWGWRFDGKGGVTELSGEVVWS